MVAVCADTTSACALNRLRERMANDYMGAKILQDKPVINTHTVDFGMLSTLPENTLGRSYVNFLKSNRVSPDSRYPVQFIDDPELAYVMQRYRETHDLNHTLLDMPITLLGEVCVKVVEAIQTGFPMCISAALLGPLKLKSEERRTFIDEHLHVAIRNGRQAEQLLNVYFEHHWESDIYDLRKKYGIITSNSYCVSFVLKDYLMLLVNLYTYRSTLWDPNFFNDVVFRRSNIILLNYVK